ncbi:MAG: NifU family protein [Bdellovibrionales bacterium]|nr:NifU family protein [Bdellovibrionales bacterium]
MAHLSPEDVLIRMWRTPNPYALKFTLNVPLKQTGKATFHAPEEAPNLPLVQSLFSIPGIKRVYLFQNQMTLTHEGQISEKEMEEQVTAIVRTRIQVHDPNFMEEQKPSVNTVKKSDDPIISQIDEILDRTVRPGLQADGGDLEVLSVENNQVKIAYQGACGGCPSAMTGTLEAIENILQHEMNKPDLTVIPV